jgi:hypothetical protein
MVFILIAGLAIALIFTSLRYNRSAPLRLAKARAALAQQGATSTISQATADLIAGEEPRSVIVRTYQQMSRLVGSKGRDLKSLTPKEVAEMARSDFDWPGEPLADLTLLFEEAWYSQHLMGEAERDRALRAFEAIASKEQERRSGLERSAS